jgi:nitrogen regulatory protein PII
VKLSPEKSVVFLTIIAEKKQQDALLIALLDAGALLINTTSVRGAASTGALPGALGLVPQKEKAAITCVLTREKSGEVFRLLAGQFHFGKPNTGIAFTVPVESLSF